MKRQIRTQTAAILIGAYNQLSIMWRGTLFQFTCLPNGLSCAPRKFTKLLKPALSTLHLRGHVSSAYLDDMYLQGKTYQECVGDVID